MVAVSNVVEYLWHDEENNYAECGCPDNHIYTDLVYIKEQLLNETVDVLK
jgi:hypothetical protein